MTPNDDGSIQTKTPEDDKLAIVQTELRSLKSALGVIAPCVALVFGLLGIALAWNVTSERDDLREFRKDIKDEVRATLGQVVDEPDIELLTPDGHLLDGAVIEPEITRNPSDPAHKILAFPIVIHNKGKGWTGPNVAIKLYTPPEIPAPEHSTDEPKFTNEVNWVGANTGISNVPSAFSSPFRIIVYVDATQTIPAGRHNCLLKFYYGRGKVAQANFSAWMKTNQ